jgi:SpoU rRNA methylase family enzyme
MGSRFLLLVLLLASCTPRETAADRCIDALERCATEWGKTVVSLNNTNDNLEWCLGTVKTLQTLTREDPEPVGDAD